MPPTADHEARRRQVATALLSVIANHGLEAASIARVAEAAGASTGLVQRYFRSKDELLLFAFDHLVEQTLARLVAAEHVGSIRIRLFRGLRTMLPLDEERITEARVTQAFATRALHSPRLRRVIDASAQMVRKQCAATLRRAQELGEAPAHLDADFEATMLVAFTDGLTSTIVADPAAISPGEADRMLLRYLDRVFEVAAPH
ncbi:TetR/AcrR family transcriptional regulator [Crossiella sp. SN42]|uniref:TetR/AcrR family transcriptional regulator n=1 Tax=Crossiella sp. SN42 TaxID=2944808 RepID=UPI00207C34C8|nr:TetR/AcrR family transcriptional regulator [Crossiella sp. SN42]MCO1579411.1 TetR/AcrR family transcriptional regulator [Crossiella sp. SN42]